MQTPRSRIERVGDLMVDAFHSVALFVIGATVIWSAIYEYLHIMHKGYAELKDILLLFIFLELGAMVGIYFKTHRLPVQFSSTWRSRRWRGTWLSTSNRCQTPFICIS